MGDRTQSPQGPREGAGHQRQRGWEGSEKKMEICGMEGSRPEGDRVSRREIETQRAVTPQGEAWGLGEGTGV